MGLIIIKLIQFIENRSLFNWPPFGLEPATNLKQKLNKKYLHIYVIVKLLYKIYLICLSVC